MNALNRAILAIIIGALAVPALGQAGGYDAEQFVAAIRKGKGDEALALLKEKPTLVNARDLNGSTALITAIESRNIDWVGYLLQQGADPGLSLRNGDTPLIIASRMGMQDVVGWLLGLGASVDDSNRSGETALIVAVQQRQVPITRALLQAGADPDRTDSVAGYSARDYARRDNRTPELLRLIEAEKPKR